MENSVRELLKTWFLDYRDVQEENNLLKYLQDNGILLIPKSEKGHPLTDQCSFMQELLAELEGLVKELRESATRLRNCEGMSYPQVAVRQARAKEKRDCADQLEKLIKKHKGENVSK